MRSDRSGAAQSFQARVADPVSWRLETPWYSVVRISLGVLLLAAACLKGYSLALSAKDGAAGWFQLGLIEFEVFAALWLFLGLAPRLTRWLAVSWFLLLAAVAACEGLMGAAFCSCLGILRLSPWIMLAVDIAAVACLLVFTPKRSYMCKRPRAHIFVGHLLVFVLGGVAVLYAGAHLGFGSALGALAWLHGDSLVLAPSVVDLGECRPGDERQLQFRVTNVSNQPLNVVGATTSCTCVIVDDLPIALSPGESCSIPVSFRVRRTSGEFVEVVTLYGDGEFLQGIRGRIRGHSPNTESGNLGR